MQIPRWTKEDERRLAELQARKESLGAARAAVHGPLMEALGRVIPRAAMKEWPSWPGTSILANQILDHMQSYASEPETQIATLPMGSTELLPETPVVLPYQPSREAFLDTRFQLRDATPPEQGDYLR